MTAGYSYLRLSLTDRCNFDCFYCRPSLRRDRLPAQAYLSCGEFCWLAKELAGRGVQHVRLTGGEPLLRPDVEGLARQLCVIPGIGRLSLTTNGYYLAQRARGLREAGVSRINISLDTLKRGRFRRLTGVDGWGRVLAGIRAARREAFEKVKLNVVLLKGVNDDEILDFVAFGEREGAEVRFIEYFVTGIGCGGGDPAFVPTATVRKVIEERFGPLSALGSDPASGPARYFRAPGRLVRLGFISSVTDFFCGTCNRLRVTCDGRIYPCLHSAYHVALADSLRRKDFCGAVLSIEDVFSNKKYYNRFNCPQAPQMSRMGG